MIIWSNASHFDEVLVRLHALERHPVQAQGPMPEIDSLHKDVWVSEVWRDPMRWN